MKQIRHALRPIDGEFLVRKEQGRIFVEARSLFDYEETVEALQRGIRHCGNLSHDPDGG